MKRIASAMVLALVLSLSPAANATIARAVSFDEKVEQADTIILGRCLHQTSRFDPSGRWILTYSTFQVSKSYKGSPAGEITIVTPGGQVGALHQETVGVPRFGEGEVNVLFVRRTNLGPSVLFFDQGAYRVTGTSDDSIVAPVESRMIVVDPATGMERDSSEPARSLRDFERDLARAVDEGKERR